MKSVEPTRPMLRYHGGKWQLAPWIVSFFPEHRVYVEPYAGAGSVLMRKPRTYCEVLNDLDQELVNIYRVMRDAESAARLEHLLRLTPFARSEWKLAYEPTEDSVERAHRCVVRSFMGFGSDSVKANRQTGFRYNSNRSGTTAATDWSRFPNHLQQFTARLQGIVIESRPALDVIGNFDASGVLFYVDPPYPHSTRRDVRGYSHEMTDDDHRELAAKLHEAKGNVFLSGYSCPLYDELFGDWKRLEKSVVVFRHSRRVECLWLNPAASKRVQKTLF